MDELGWDLEKLDEVAFGVVLPLREAIRVCQLEAPEGWTPRAYELIRRSDLARQIRGRARVPTREGVGAGMLGKVRCVMGEKSTMY